MLVQKSSLFRPEKSRLRMPSIAASRAASLGRVDGITQVFEIQEDTSNKPRLVQAFSGSSIEWAKPGIGRGMNTGGQLNLELPKCPPPITANGLPRRIRRPAVSGGKKDAFHENKRAWFLVADGARYK
jgi:hypothetical protein